MLFGAGVVHFSDGGIDVPKNVRVFCPIADDPIPVNWANAEDLSVDTGDLERDGVSNARFQELPSAAVKAKNYDVWAKEFADWIYRSQALTLFRSPALELSSTAGESERDFRVRLQQTARETRDREVEALRRKYAAKIAVLEERLRRARQAQTVQEEQAKAAKMQTVISFGATLLGSLLGRKAIGTATLGRATTAARSVSRTVKESADIARAKETVEAVEGQLQALNADVESEIDRLTSASDPVSGKIETLSVEPKKKDIAVQLVALAWVPFVQGPGKEAVPAH
jgi:hypothetical protein